MNFELLRVAIALGATGLAAWQDHKTSFIDDKITLGMIAAGILLDVLTLDLSFMIWVAAIALVIAAVGYFAYKTGQFGGGDVLLLLGLHLLLPVYPFALASPFLPSLYVFFQPPFVFSVFLASSFLAVFGSAWLLYAPSLWTQKQLRKKLSLVVIAAIIAFLAPLFLLPFTLTQELFFLFLGVSAVFLVVFKKEIMDCVVVQRIKISQIEDEDILAVDKMPEKLVKKYALEKVLTKSEVDKLRKIEKTGKMRAFPVCKVLPRFGPYVFFGLLLCLLVGDLIIALLS
jgi:Flp pilus assembly protein protease CpaA